MNQNVKDLVDEIVASVQSGDFDPKLVEERVSSDIDKWLGEDIQKASHEFDVFEHRRRVEAGVLPRITEQWPRVSIDAHIEELRKSFLIEVVESLIHQALKEARNGD